ncbi:MAG TPA: prolyl oligopeptidase family serine peptidase [Aliidongia sp.]|uniref:prolyl oligopeptidase family serine peptidase n=1 Tax=Aliidongia sp. TaxID=1914230 RepID=UPI002DDCFC30|nr:prolyl oligopeptidase family serine peptidase [Aliidongia sp.]HEV2677816.1 prolyl oligopeptidase family serine peptidase [Aliidongia sp.]
MRHLKLALALSMLGLVGIRPAPAATPTPDPADPYIWLEDVSSPRVDAWVKAENAKTVGVLEQDVRFKTLYDQALEIAEAKDRIPTPRFLDGAVYNFWQDADHVRGVWRKTNLAEYRKPDPAWTTVLDLDQFAKTEKANWVWHGASCRRPDERVCLVSLSDGGEDAVTTREFDLATGQFVKGGFTLPKSKGAATWTGEDEILVARDWGKGTLTTAGYPYVVKALKRGQKLSAAHEIFRGKPSDTEVSPTTLEDGAGHKAVFIERGISFFESETYLVQGGQAVKLALPLKAHVADLVAGRLLVKLEQDWSAGGKSFAQGSLVSMDLAAVAADPQHLAPTLVYAPGPRESLDGIASTRSHLILTMLDNVKGRASVYTPTAEGGWSERKLDLPDNSAIDILDTEAHGEDAFLSVTGFLTPSSVLLADTALGGSTTVKALPAKFDASKDVVEQKQATSKDGTKIPYFVVHPAGMALDGNNPTVLYAYGGFQVSITPFYSANVGKLWLERGGVFVVANIRGGGEFGPAWHDAGLKTHRQKIYDDFAAVAEDLIQTKVTSPRRLGIQGGSNGGLLMGVEFTQRPDLWNAVDIQVPLLDMLRFEKIAAGPSWVGEYGTVANPEERAFLASISPYANLKPGVKYPEPFVWTTTKDDRVGPQHARKFAAKLAELGAPYLFYEVTEGGHGAGANLKEKARTTAMEMTYFSRKLMD